MKVLLGIAMTIFAVSFLFEVDSQREPGIKPIFVAQTMGSKCQTRFGVCPVLDGNGTQVSLPLGSPCSCGQDPGFVIP